MNIYFLSAALLLAVCPAEAHFRHFHSHSSGVPYYHRPEWIEYHAMEKEIIIDIDPPKSQDDVHYLLARLEEINHKITTIKGKLNFPGIMSLRYRQSLEKDLSYLTKERDQIQRRLKESSVHSRVVVDPFITYPVYNRGYYHHYPAFRKTHP